MSTLSPSLVPALGRFVNKANTPTVKHAKAGSCELCRTPTGPDHPHLIDLTNRGLLCACRACGLLFSQDGAAQGRYRVVPDRVLSDSNFTLTDGDWGTLQIPVRMAFFFFNSELEKWVSFYPSPAGATESLLGFEGINELVERCALFKEAKPDVEAVLVFGREHERSFDTLLVPINVCYELVGIVKLNWRGFSGGAEAWTRLEEFFARLKERAEPVATKGERA